MTDRPRHIKPSRPLYGAKFARTGESGVHLLDSVNCVNHIPVPFLSAP